MTNEPLEASDNKLLKQMSIRYGLYRVLTEFSRIAKEECKDYSLDAVIHLDSEMLERCVKAMKNNHFLRIMSEG